MLIQLKKKIKKFLGELAFVSILLCGLIGIFFFLWFFDVHTFDITITRAKGSGPF